MKIKEISTSLGIVMLIGQYLLWTDALLHDIVFFIGGNIISEKTRKKKVVATKVEYRCNGVSQLLTCDGRTIPPSSKIVTQNKRKHIVIIKQLSTLLPIFNSIREPNTNTERLTIIFFEKSCPRKFVLSYTNQIINLQMN